MFLKKKFVFVTALVIMAAAIGITYALVTIITHTVPPVTVPAGPMLSSPCTTLTANPGTSGSTTVLLTCGTSPAFSTTAACSPSCTATVAATFPAQPSYTELGLVQDGTRNAAGNSPCGAGPGFIGQVTSNISLQVTFSTTPAPGQVSTGSYDYCLFYATGATAAGATIPSFQITWSQ